MDIIIGILIIIASILWAVLQEFARGMASAPSMHSMSHVVSIIGLLIGIGLVVYGIVT